MSVTCSNYIIIRLLHDAKSPAQTVENGWWGLIKLLLSRHVLLVRDVLGFGARQTGWLFTYIGVLIIIVQGGLISRAVLRFGEMKTIIAGVALLAIGRLLTVALAFGSQRPLSVLVLLSLIQH